MEPFTEESLTETLKQFEKKGRSAAKLITELRAIDRKLRQLQDIKMMQNGEHQLSNSTVNEPQTEVQETKKFQIEKHRELRENVIRQKMFELSRTFELAYQNYPKKPITFNLIDGPARGTTTLHKLDKADMNRIIDAEAAKALQEVLQLSPLNANRHSTVSALKSALARNYTHAIIKCDIENYYGSISQELILEKISSNARIGNIIKTITRGLLEDYRSKAKQDRGIPQGLAISAKLAEIYLQTLDYSISHQKGVIFYARYVDDIVVVLEDDNVSQLVFDLIEKELKGLKLTLNKTKTTRITTNSEGNYPRNTNLQFLGYRFNRKNGNLAIDLPESRINTRKERIKAAFGDWSTRKDDQPLNASEPNTGKDGLLVLRIRYLARNSRLSNSKQHVLIGLNASSPEIDCNILKSLDKYLTDQISRHKKYMSQRLIDKLCAINFVRAFEKREFIVLSAAQLSTIKKCWMATNDKK